LYSAKVIFWSLQYFEILILFAPFYFFLVFKNPFECCDLWVVKSFDFKKCHWAFVFTSPLFVVDLGHSSIADSGLACLEPTPVIGRKKGNAVEKSFVLFAKDFSPLFF